jgi:cell division protein YceG involved in septum cleavage
MDQPKLTEPGTKYFLTQTLKECRKFKTRNVNLFFNASMTLLLLFVVGGLLLYKYRGKPTKAEIAKKNNDKHVYIMSKLNQLTIAKSKNNTDLITNIPLWNNSVK